MLTVSGSLRCKMLGFKCSLSRLSIQICFRLSLLMLILTPMLTRTVVTQPLGGMLIVEGEGISTKSTKIAHIKFLYRLNSGHFLEFFQLF
ncbi:unnamed protein product [Moneuplotes crassus]|uniref:Uncharacterized protein n=1 Tax=Euplotes crassus TaxID=5936 RepID=A0AAD1Y066_EUPCR|nr:unnamed protein product [Moneuplotes crassus]